MTTSRLLSSVLVAAAACAAALLAPSCAQRARCTIDDECGEGRCLQGFCATPCGAEDPCDKGQACVRTDSGEGACATVQGDLPEGARCTSDLECGGGACFGDGDARTCAHVCTLDRPCDDGLRCSLDGVRRLCVPPTGNGVVGDACTASSACESGTCVTVPGERGFETSCIDACSARVACASADDVCVPVPGGAALCVAPIADGLPCPGGDACAGGLCIADVGGAVCARPCDGGSCADGFFCVNDSDDNPVCMPALDARGPGVACDDARECTSGLCVHFNDGTTDYGRLCAEPCPSTAPDACGDGRVCWEGDVSVCGPQPGG